MRRGIMGGTFDPVHVGHLELARHAQAQLGLGEVLWIPAGDPWRKPEAAVTAGEHRLEMIRLAIVDEPTWSASALEVERDGPTFSVDTVERLQAMYVGDTLVMLLGLDALEDLPNWHRPERLIELIELAVATRGRTRPTDEDLEALLAGLSRRVTWVEMPLVPTSATEVRRLAAEGKSLAGKVPPAVEDYVRSHGLYGAA